ncbi:hypothetical protein KNP414_06840 [Paenibacillus mucilaginosus KNP414]|nr:hypothetical protein KNP414_06840 [Paenibacillus mucilaginosus KNP414]
MTNFLSTGYRIQVDPGKEGNRMSRNTTNNNGKGRQPGNNQDSDAAESTKEKK